MSAARPAHSWEEALGRRDWERVLSVDDLSSDSEPDDDFDSCTKEEASQELCEYLIDLKIQGVLTQNRLA